MDTWSIKLKKKKKLKQKNKLPHKMLLYSLKLFCEQFKFFRKSIVSGEFCTIFFHPFILTGSREEVIGITYRINNHSHSKVS